MSSVQTQIHAGNAVPERLTASLWIFSPLQDLAFVLLTPLPILMTFAIARRGAWMDGLLAFLLTLAMAHYLPGILRAYGDSALFRRFRVRLILAPLLLYTVTATFAYLNLHMVILLSLLWGQWHWMMQIYGFARIYDAKAPPEARTVAWLDKSVCLMWFGMCVFVINVDLPSFLTRFYESGGPRIPSGVFAWFTRAWLAATIVITAAYAFRVLSSIREGRSPNPLKFVFVAATFVYLSYTTGVVDRPLMGLAMFESWHDIQYLAIVWLFNVNRARHASDAGRFIRFLFRPSAILALIYVVSCLVFGSLTHAWTLFKNDAIVRIVMSIVTGTAMLHYYLDGFIWKIREKETSQALGVRAQVQPVRSKPGPHLPIAVPAWARHAALWLLLFAVPAGLFFVVELNGNVQRHLAIYEAVVETFPRSPMANYQIGRELQDMGRLREAKAHYERALAAAPNMLPAHVFLGVLLTDQKDLDGAKLHFERALAMDPKNAEVHNNLGIVLDEQGDLANARIHLERSTALDPKYALAHTNLGMVLAKLGDLSGAADHLETALRLDPEQYLAHNSLGEILLKQSKPLEAKTHFEQALRIEPDYSAAKKNIAAIQGQVYR